MLFNSYEFLLVFFPGTISAYFLLGRTAIRRTVLLAVVSLVFYASWNWRFLPLLVGSIIVNYAAGILLSRTVTDGMSEKNVRYADILLAVGIALNLLVLGIFKYAFFVLNNVNLLTGTSIVLPSIIIPLGISFFTFEQIGFLIDIRRGHRFHLNLLRYCVFVAFFPRLVAGPILRYSEIVPQLERDGSAVPQGLRNSGDIWSNLAVGLSMFSVGLVKKAFLADGISPFVAQAFSMADAGEHVDLLMAWGGALAYTCQLYFDFSGYSDMAIGAARCFGLSLPQNFNSPYKSVSIVEFWRRWHITLSRFLRDYLYIPLGGNRRGRVRRYVNLLITMTLGGLWHGANWTFLVWGLLHGMYLAINHGWAAATSQVGRLEAFSRSSVGLLFGRSVTFFAVVIAWVFFRAPSFHAAFAMLGAMVDLQGVEIPAAVLWHFPSLAKNLEALGIQASGRSGTQFVDTWLWIAALLSVAFFGPNTQQIFAQAHPTLEHPPQLARIFRWSAKPAWAVAVAFVAFAGLLSVTRGSAFLYWQF